MKLQKFIFLALLIIFSYSISFAQEIERKGSVGFSIGPSFPIGDFGSNSLTNGKAGLAQIGVITELNFAYRLGKNFGIAAILRGQNNSVDVNAFSVLTLSIPGISIDVDASNWKIGGFLAGGYGSFPTSKALNTYFDCRALVGVVNATSPSLKFTISDPSGSEWVKQEESNAAAFGLLFGGGFRFNLSEKMALLTNADFLMVSAKFKDVKSSSSLGDNAKTDFTQAMSTFNLSIGIALRLK